MSARIDLSPAGVETLECRRALVVQAIAAALRVIVVQRVIKAHAVELLALHQVGVTLASIADALRVEVIPVHLVSMCTRAWYRQANTFTCRWYHNPASKFL